jgi:hypothetical protein
LASLPSTNTSPSPTRWWSKNSFQLSAFSRQLSVAGCPILFCDFAGCPILKLVAQQRALGWDRTSLNQRALYQGASGEPTQWVGRVPKTAQNTNVILSNEHRLSSLAKWAAQSAAHESKDLRLLLPLSFAQSKSNGDLRLLLQTQLRKILPCPSPFAPFAKRVGSHEPQCVPPVS